MVAETNVMVLRANWFRASWWRSHGIPRTTGVAKFGDKKEGFFQVLLSLEFGSDEMGYLSGRDRLAINDLELAWFLQGDEGRIPYQ